MSSYHDDDDVTRDGFHSSYGRFYASPGRVERVDGFSLRRMFLPKLTPEGRKCLNAGYSDYFVRGQLKHYGILFDEREFSGNGTLLLKKVLQAGKCDKVPDHISELREQMHAQWINKRTPEQLYHSPEWFVEKYFLSSGRPDHTKTTTVVGMPLDRFSSYRAGQVREAASNVTGLHQETGFGPKTQTVFMGWDPVAVSKAARGHAAKEAKQQQAAENERENDRAQAHTNYLASLKRKKSPKGPKTHSLVGSYIVRCKEIEEQWPDQADDLNLDISQSDEPGIFEASFEFGVLEGVMIISAEEDALERYCSQLDREAEPEWDEEDDDEYETESARKPTTGSKRKAEAPQGQGRPTKKSNSGAVQPHTYLLKLKCRETGEGEIQYTAQKGSLRFRDKTLTSFIGKADLPCVGQGVPFSGRKISDVPTQSGNEWADYSESAHGYANVRRWH